MARLYVWARDQVVVQGADTNKCWKKGDMVDVVEDGGSLGTSFDGHEAFEILEVPGVPASKFYALRSGETETLNNGTLDLVRKRLFGIDIDALAAKVETLTEVDIKPTEKDPIVKSEVIGK